MVNLKNKQNRKKDINSMFIDEIEKDFVELGLKKYRAKQVFSWLSKGICDFFNMSDLPLDLREKLKNKYYISRCEIREKQVSDGAIKYVLDIIEDDKLDEANLEVVLMKYKYGDVVCISTQVGCKMKCSFCANSQARFIKNLTVSQMLAQVFCVCADIGKRVSNITLMGIGEPFDNYANVIKFLKIVTCDTGFNIGSRHVTVSTCGICDKIKKFADEKIPISLCVSLHSVIDSVRNKLMPVNKINNVKSLINACKYYIFKTRKRITFEYVLIKDLNDSFTDAKNLVKIIYDMNAHVNLIPVNNIESASFEPSSEEIIRKFHKTLLNSGISVTIRRTLGKEIDAACGQLKNRIMSKNT